MPIAYSMFATLAQADTSVLPALPSGTGTPVVWLVALAALALLPFVLVIITPFAKIVIVGGLLRSALGTPQIPPNTVITGLAMILALYVMSPVVSQIVERTRACMEAQGASDSGAAVAADGGGVVNRLPELATHGLEPLYRFLFVNCKPRELELFDRLARDIDARASGEPKGDPPGDTVAWIQSTLRSYGAPESAVESPGIGSLKRLLAVVVPAFILSELTEALQIAFLIFVPFIVIDLFVTNLLLAVGMQQMTPTVISLPLKLLVFVMMDGWRLIVQGILLGYEYQVAALAGSAAGGGA